MTIPRILIVAGSDSGGGAGIQADIKTVTMLGGHAMTAVTAITVQNTLGVTGVLPVPPETIVAQIDAVWDDIGVDAVKIGMIGTAAAARAVAAALAARPPVPVVVDPVMVATSGATLADDGTVAALEALIATATIVTPNAPELAVLTGGPIADEGALRAAAGRLAARTGRAVLAKGGHLPGDTVIDLLITPEGETRWEAARIVTRHSHGTGCTLASAVATGLGGGLTAAAAVARARRYVRATLTAAPGLGRGHGPMGHGLGRAWDGSDREHSA
ncbi:MAG: bifunctional hydroxymethylpyrimidine kinase/phosphomethylpyrimidine kinase [Sphingomonas fennica]